MAKILALVVLLVSHSSLAADMASGGPGLGKSQQVGLLILSGLTLAWAAPNMTDAAPKLLCTDEFVFASTWVGNIFGVFDAVAWTCDFISGYIYYKKGDSRDVAALKNRIQTLKAAEHRTHKKRMKEVANICDQIITHIQSKDDQDPMETKRELLDLISYAEEILNTDIDNRPISVEVIPGNFGG